MRKNHLKTLPHVACVMVKKLNLNTPQITADGINVLYICTTLRTSRWQYHSWPLLNCADQPVFSISNDHVSVKIFLYCTLELWMWCALQTLLICLLSSLLFLCSDSLRWTARNSDSCNQHAPLQIHRVQSAEKLLIRANGACWIHEKCQWCRSHRATDTYWQSDTEGPEPRKTKQ